MNLLPNHAGNYRFLRGIAPYSAGVIADDGFEIVHVAVLGLPDYMDGFQVIERHLQQQSRPLAALCAVELRSPAPFSFDGFARFNDGYRRALDERSLLLDEVNPIARTNIAPAQSPPGRPALYGFAYTRPSTLERSTFIVAGAGDVRRQELDSQDIVRAGETSDDAMREKAAHVMSVMSERVRGLGLAWDDATHINVYTVRALHAFVQDTLLGPIGNAALRGLQWHYAWPPIAGLEFEMDLRGTRTELNL